MSVVVFRVDERLIHGQVVLGWARPYRVERIIVVDDALAEERLEQDIYRTGLPERIRADFWSVSDAARRLPEVMEGEEPAIVLTEDVEGMWRLAVEGVPIAEVNIGGIHACDGRRRILSYVCLDKHEVQRVRDLEAAGVRVIARDVPSAAPVRLTQSGV